MAQTAMFVKCPVCSQSLVNWMINQHIEECLSRNDDETPPSKLEVLKNTASNLSKSPDVTQSRKSTKSSSFIAGNKLSKTKSPESSESRKNESRSFTSPPFKRAKMEKIGPTTSVLKKNDGKVEERPVLKQNTKQEVNGTKAKREKFVPLAEKLRPQTLDEYVGQTRIIGDKSMLKNLLESDEVPSMIFWGPPGCGKVDNMFLYGFRKGGMLHACNVTN